MTWRYHTPERDGHAPDDWVEGMEWQYRHLCVKGKQYITHDEPPAWLHGLEYRYRPLQDATVEPDWIDWVPQYKGHAPLDWDGNRADFYCGGRWTKAVPSWLEGRKYRYYRAVDVKPSFDTLKDQCLALPQDQREALIEAMQKPQRDWAAEVWKAAHEAYFTGAGDPAQERRDAIAVIRSMCRPKEDERIQAAERIIEVIHNAGVSNLSRGVQLGAVSWSVKMNDALAWYNDAKAALS